MSRVSPDQRSVTSEECPLMRGCPLIRECPLIRVLYQRVSPDERVLHEKSVP